MGYNFNNWDSDARGTLFAGQIRRGSQSTSKAWAEENLTAVDLAAGTFVTMNAAGGVKAVSAATDIIHGIVLADIYGETTPNDKILNIAHCGHGDEFVAVAVSEQAFARGDVVYIVATGDDAGKITKVALDNIATAYIATYVSGDLVAFTRREVPAPAPEPAPAG